MHLSLVQPPRELTEKSSDAGAAVRELCAPRRSCRKLGAEVVESVGEVQQLSIIRANGLQSLPVLEAHCEILFLPCMCVSEQRGDCL